MSYTNNKQPAKVATAVRIGSSHRNGYGPSAGRNNSQIGPKYGGVPSSAVAPKNEINGAHKGYQAVGMGPRNNSKIQAKNGGANIASPLVQNMRKNHLSDFEVEDQQIRPSGLSQPNGHELLDEIERLQNKVEQMAKIINEKDQKIESQQRDITGLRKKNFEFRAKLMEVEDKQREKKRTESKSRPVDQRELRAGAEERKGEQPTGNNDTVRQIQLAMQMQQQEARNRERDIMMQVMMNSMLGGNSAAAEEERLLQRAIEESKADNMDPTRPDIDNMTYEQIMELEENNGKISKGLSPSEIAKIPERMWMKKNDTGEQSCSICFEEFAKYQKFKKIAGCSHEYHSSCLDKWLKEQKKCPICNKEVV